MRRFYDADLEGPEDPTARCVVCGREGSMDEGDEAWILPEGWLAVGMVRDSGLCPKCADAAERDERDAETCTFN